MLILVVPTNPTMFRSSWRYRQIEACDGYVAGLLYINGEHVVGPLRGAHTMQNTSF